MQEVSLLGPFSEDQAKIISSELTEVGPINVSVVPRVEDIPSDAIVAVRAGIHVPASRQDLLHVISAGSGTSNIDRTETRNIYNCRGENAPETAAHAVSLGIAGLQEVYIGEDLPAGDINVGIIGAGHVGTNAALIMEELGFNVVCSTRSEIDPESTYLFTNDISSLIRESDLIILAASEANVITSENIPQFLDFQSRPGRVVVNIARANVISDDALTQLRKTQGLLYLSDVWQQEPAPGEEFPLVTATQITGKDGLRQIPGTMHQGAQQISSNLAVATRVAEIMKKILLRSEVNNAPDARVRYLEARKRLTHYENRSIVNLGEISDVRRVHKLRSSLDTIADEVISGRKVVWSQPAMIPAPSGNMHDLVGLVRSVIKKNV